MDRSVSLGSGLESLTAIYDGGPAARSLSDGERSKLLPRSSSFSDLLLSGHGGLSDLSECVAFRESLHVSLPQMPSTASRIAPLPSPTHNHGGGHVFSPPGALNAPSDSKYGMPEAVSIPTSAHVAAAAGHPSETASLLCRFQHRLALEVAHALQAAAAATGDARTAHLNELLANIMMPVEPNVLEKLNSSPRSRGCRPHLCYFHLISEYYAAALPLTAELVLDAAMRNSRLESGSRNSPQHAAAPHPPPRSSSDGGTGTAAGAQASNGAGTGASSVGAGSAGTSGQWASHDVARLLPVFMRLWSHEMFPPIFALLFHLWLLGRYDDVAYTMDVGTQFSVLCNGANRIFWHDIATQATSYSSLYACLIGAATHPTKLAQVPPRLRSELYEVVCRFFLYYEDPATLPAFLRQLPALSNDQDGDTASVASSLVGASASVAGGGGGGDGASTRTHSRAGTDTGAGTGIGIGVEGSVAAGGGAASGHARNSSTSGFGALTSVSPAAASRAAAGQRASQETYARNKALFVSELCRHLRGIRSEAAVLTYLAAVGIAFKDLPLDVHSRNRLQGALSALTTPGGPLYPTRKVRHTAQATMDAIFPVGRYARRLVHICFRLLHPLTWPPSLMHWLRMHAETCLARMRGRTPAPAALTSAPQAGSSQNVRGGDSHGVPAPDSNKSSASAARGSRVAEGRVNTVPFVLRIPVAVLELLIRRCSRRRATHATAATTSPSAVGPTLAGSTGTISMPHAEPASGAVDGAARAAAKASNSPPAGDIAHATGLPSPTARVAGTTVPVRGATPVQVPLPGAVSAGAQPLSTPLALLEEPSLTRIEPCLDDDELSLWEYLRSSYSVGVVVGGAARVLQPVLWLTPAPLKQWAYNTAVAVLQDKPKRA